MSFFTKATDKAASFLMRRTRGGFEAMRREAQAWWGAVLSETAMEKADPSMLARRALLPGEDVQGKLAVTDYRGRPGSRVTWGTLRTLSEIHAVTRACIKWRRRQLESMKWNITAIEEQTDRSRDIEAAKEFFSTRGGLGGPGMRLRHFLGMTLEDLLVFDAMALVGVANQVGGTHSIRVVDPTTIQPLVDSKGWAPEPPLPAYRQVVHGRVLGEWTTEEMRYEMFNPRSNSAYGFSPLEALVMVVDAALRSELWNLAWFTTGNLPEGIFQAPETWSPGQVIAYQAEWNALLEGNFAKQAQGRFVPVGLKWQPTKTRGDWEFGEWQDWLAMLTCIMFEVQPAAIGMTGTVFKFAQMGQIELTKLWGMQPTLELYKEIFDDILKEDLGFEGLEWRWDPIEREDLSAQAKRHEILVSSGLETLNEARNELGLDGAEGEYADELKIITQSGPLKLARPADAPPAPAIEPPPMPPQSNGQPDRQGGQQGGANDGQFQPGSDGATVRQTFKEEEEEIQAGAGDRQREVAAYKAELQAWRKKALKDLRRFGEVRRYSPDVLPGVIAAPITEALRKIEGSERRSQINAVFEEALRAIGSLAAAG